MTARIVVVGGGIAGLSAAFYARRRGFSVTVLEGSKRFGGKLLRAEIAGVSTDLGAEALLARRPEAVDLAREVGLGGELVPPATTQAAVYSRGRLRPLPAGHVMGVPRNLRSLAATGIVPPTAVLRAAADLILPPTPVGDDVSVARGIGIRLGRGVVDRLVEPLLGGVYAGRADRLSLRATLPQLVDVLDRGSLLRGLRDLPPPGGTGPVFAGLPGGVARLGEALVDVLRADGVELRTSAMVRVLRRTPTGWRCEVGPASAPEAVDADAVVVAVPAPAAARMLGPEAGGLAAELAGIEYASVAVVTLAFPADQVNLPAGSGFLVPAVERRLVKAATFSSVKWPWYAGSDVAVVRCSIGRFGDTADLQRDDAELVAGALADLAAIVGIRAQPIDSIVTRWAGALPQYDVGHLARVARIRSAAARLPGFAFCGAAYDGVGIPACIAGAQRAVASLTGPRSASRAAGRE